MIFKRHGLIGIAYISISIIGLVVSLSISSALDMGGLTYSVVLTFPFIGLAGFLRFLNESRLEKFASNGTQQNKKKINSSSLIFSILSGIINVLPALIVIILYACNIDKFNPYMLIALYIAYFIAYITSTIIEQKKANQQSQPQQSKE